jgi:hypothetical protein
MAAAAAADPPQADSDSDYASIAFRPGQPALLVVAAGEPAATVRDPEPKTNSADSSPAEIVYRPPRRGAAIRRAAGGVRGGSKALPTPLALAPGHVALTTRQAPSLFWHIDGTLPAGARVFFTLNAPMEPNPVAETELELPQKAGIQRLRLERLGVSLEPGLEYEWFISLVPDMTRREADITSGGVIRRVNDTGIQERNPSAALYASHGFWYDALESLSDGIATSPQDSSLRAQRNSLLEQGDLGAASDE